MSCHRAPSHLTRIWTGIGFRVGTTAAALCLATVAIGGGLTLANIGDDAQGNSVESVASGLADVGWDGCSTASHHSVDRGFAGLETTIKALDGLDLGYAGTTRHGTPTLSANDVAARLARVSE